MAMNLAHLGADTALFGFTGADSHRELLVESLNAHGITSHLVASSEFPTTSKLRVLGGQQQMIRLDHERVGRRTQGDYDQLAGDILSELPGTAAVVLSDYAKGVLTSELCQTIIGAARKLDIPTLVDPKSADFSRYRGATTICPNLSELAHAAHCEPSGVDALLSEAEGMVGRFDFEFLVVTMSDQGIALIRPGQRLLDPAVARQVFDVSGAGDTVIATLALSLASQLKPETGIQLANLAAGVVVGKVGTIPIEKHELLAALNSEITLQPEGKFLTLKELSYRMALWRRNGDRVVFTNGCFDLLHVGHISVIEQARRLGDRLVVAINSDCSVGALKGAGRPLVSQSERARVLAALGAVDAVVIFDEPTPLELILAIRPDVLVKGGDYNAESIVGAREVESWGGQVQIVPTLEGFSTTRMIEKGILSASFSKS